MHRCEETSKPNTPLASSTAAEIHLNKAQFWYDGNPTASIKDGSGGTHYFGKLKSAENVRHGF